MSYAYFNGLFGTLIFSHLVPGNAKFCKETKLNNTPVSESAYRFHSPSAVLHYRVGRMHVCMCVCGCVCVCVHALDCQQAAACWRRPSRRASSLRGVTSTYEGPHALRMRAGRARGEHRALVCTGEHKRAPECPSFSSSRGVKGRIATLLERGGGRAGSAAGPIQRANSSFAPPSSIMQAGKSPSAPAACRSSSTCTSPCANLLVQRSAALMHLYMLLVFGASQTHPEEGFHSFESVFARDVWITAGLDGAERIRPDGILRIRRDRLKIHTRTLCGETPSSDSGGDLFVRGDK